jgi:hypothetical protein
VSGMTLVGRVQPIAVRQQTARKRHSTAPLKLLTIIAPRHVPNKMGAIELLKPTTAWLPSYVAALEAGWSPDNARKEVPCGSNINCQRGADNYRPC